MSDNMSSFEKACADFTKIIIKMAKTPAMKRMIRGDKYPKRGHRSKLYRRQCVRK